MSDCYLGEIRMFGFGRVPAGWLRCDGALYPIEMYPGLFSVIQTTYGGDGQATFATPQLSGRLPIHQGQGPGLSAYAPGQRGGSEQAALALAQIPAHHHPMAATTGLATAKEIGATVVLGALPGDTMYATDLTGAAPFLTAPQSTSPGGGNQAHDNLMPTLTVQFCIATEGALPGGNPGAA